MEAGEVGQDIVNATTNGSQVPHYLLIYRQSRCNEWMNGLCRSTRLALDSMERS